VVIPRLPHVARKISNLTTARNNAKPLSVAQRRHPVSQRANITQPCPSSTTSSTCSRCVPSFPHRENGALRSLPSKHVPDKRSAAASRRPFTPAPPPRPLCYLDCARVRAPCFLSSSGSPACPSAVSNAQTRGGNLSSSLQSQMQKVSCSSCARRGNCRF
jgi:hypothetical protein